MARTGTKRHVHKYFRLQSDGLWHCGHPDCTHFMPSNMPEPVWRQSRCWSCGRIIGLTPDNMKYTHPTCDTCEPYLPSISVNYDDDFASALDKMMREGREKKRLEEIEKSKAKMQAEYERAQSTNTVEEDKPESEDIPPKYDVE